MILGGVGEFPNLAGVKDQEWADHQVHAAQHCAKHADDKRLPITCPCHKEELAVECVAAQQVTHRLLLDWAEVHTQDSA